MKLHDSYIGHCPNKILKKTLIHINELMYRIRMFTRIEPARHVKEAFHEQRNILAALQLMGKSIKNGSIRRRPILIHKVGLKQILVEIGLKVIN